MVLDSLRGDEKEVILITEDQVNNFAGNMLEVKGTDDRRYLVMSKSAHQSLTKKQIAPSFNSPCFLVINSKIYNSSK